MNWNTGTTTCNHSIMKKMFMSMLLLCIIMLDHYQVRAFVSHASIKNIQPTFLYPAAMDKFVRMDSDFKGSRYNGNMQSLNHHLNRRNDNRCSRTRCNMLEDSSILYSTSQLLTTSGIHKSIEAEIFGDLAHLFLDFATFFAPDTVVLRLFIVCGRIFSILSDYVPDGEMETDEALIQFSMLGLSCKMFFVKFNQILASATKSSSFRDRRIYQCIFRPAGFSWTQYLALMNDALEWIDVPEGTMFSENPDNLLITYKGLLRSNQTHRNGSKQHQSETLYGKRNGRSSHDVVGDLSSLARLTGKETKRQKDSTISSIPSMSVASLYTNANEMDMNVQVFQAMGGCGASMLRINTERLFEVASNDAYLKECTKNLFFNAAQDRLTYYEPTAKTGSASEFPIPSSVAVRHSYSPPNLGNDDGMYNRASNETAPHEHLLRA